MSGQHVDECSSSLGLSNGKALGRRRKWNRPQVFMAPGATFHLTHATWLCTPSGHTCSDSRSLFSVLRTGKQGSETTQSRYREQKRSVKNRGTIPRGSNTSASLSLNRCRFLVHSFSLNTRTHIARFSNNRSPFIEGGVRFENQIPVFKTAIPVQKTAKVGFATGHSCFEHGLV